MVDNVITLEVPMPKNSNIQIRTTDEAKEAIAAAADRNGRSMSNWLLWLAAQADEAVAKALKK